MAGQANATRACSSLAWAGQADVPPRPSRRGVLARPDSVPGREPEIGWRWYGRCVPGCVERRRSPGRRLPDNGRVRRAGGRARYRRSRFRRSARACAGAAARRTTVSWAAVRARGTGRRRRVHNESCALRSRCHAAGGSPARHLNARRIQPRTHGPVRGQSSRPSPVCRAACVADGDRRTSTARVPGRYR